MRPWQVAVGLGAAIGGVAVLLLLPRFAYLGPYAGFIAREYWLALGLYGGAALFTVMVLLAGLARQLGLVELGRKVDFGGAFCTEGRG